MVKPPVVQLAGMLRALGRYIDTDAWIWLCEPAGQVLFRPPNVSGWDDTRWLDTSRMRARWNIVDYALDEISVDAWDGSYSTTETADEALARALASWGSPALRAEHRAELLDFAQRAEKLVDRQLAARPLPGDAPERPAAADRHQPGHDPAMSPRPRTTAAATTPAPSCCARPRPKPARGCR